MLKKISTCTILLFCLLNTHIVSNAQETEEISDKEIVIVIDCSESMKDADSQYYAFDFVKCLVEALPRDYQIGMVAYNNEVCANLPLNSRSEIVDNTLNELKYTNYGNAGAGLSAAIALFGNEEAEKRIILVSDGEIMMKTEEATDESADLFANAVQDAKREGIVIDIVALGQRIEEGYTVYSAAEFTHGQIYDLEVGDALADLTKSLIFDEWKINASHVGKLDGTNVELSVKLPDCLMSRAKLLMIGKQQNENIAVNCDADRINVSKGKYYTVIELLQPNSGEVKIQMTADEPVDINAYLTAEYDFSLSTGHIYNEETQTAEIWMDITNSDGKSLLEGHLKEGGVTVYLDSDEQDYRITDGKIYLEKQYEQDSTAKLDVSFDGLYADYYGDISAEEEIIVPVIEEEPPKIDWFFWSVITLFVAALVLLFFISWRRQRKAGNRKHIVNDNRVLEKQNAVHKNNFFGKVQIFVIRNKDDIDYPPESINLFARCNREMITLEWILDTCNLPLNLKGAEQIIIKPGDDKSLIVKNSSKATALMGRELLIKNHSYHLYYHEKVTFIFDEEDTEIEMHYKDLKPNER